MRNFTGNADDWSVIPVKIFCPAVFNRMDYDAMFFCMMVLIEIGIL